MGDRVEAATWFMGVCPTEPDFREYRFTQLRNLLQEFELDGAWLDYVHWHAQFEDPAPILPETCFCNNCLEKFTHDTRIQLPNGTTEEKAQWILSNNDSSWRDWRCKVIFEWANEMKSILKEANPDALVYHGRMERSPEWVVDNIKWFSDRLNIQKNKGPKIWSIVQASNHPNIISSDEFETVLRGGLSGKASGVMMFTSFAVAEDKGKTEIMRKVYNSLREQSE